MSIDAKSVFDPIFGGSQKPPSEKIAEFEGGEYFVLAAIWRTNSMDGTQWDTFEISIREKKTGKFWLLQSEKLNHQSVQEVANAIAMLLSDKTQSYDPDWCQEHFV